MIIFLLLVIVFILLFGAAAVRCWGKAMLTNVLIFIALFLGLVGTSSIVGKDNVPLVLLGLVLLMLLTPLLLKPLDQWEAKRARKRQVADERQYRIDLAAKVEAETRARDEQRAKEIAEARSIFDNARTLSKEERRQRRKEYKASQFTDSLE